MDKYKYGHNFCNYDLLQINSPLQMMAKNLAYDFCEGAPHFWTLRENKKASRPAYDLLIRKYGQKRGRVVMSFFISDKR
tara:strand:- start:3707 stop:3943 length:237 start_codon:yes stop_codon:yes gene_type:complete